MYLTDLLSFLHNNCRKGDACYKLIITKGGAKLGGVKGAGLRVD